jgi:hypothetical protein
MLIKAWIFILVLLVASSSQAHAQSATTSPATVSPTTTIKNQMQNLKDQRKAAVGELKADIKNARDDFKAKISAIKDERKKMVVGKIDDHVASANARLTSKMSNTLTRLTDILNKFKERASALKTGGANTAALDSAIAAAEAAIASAQTKVTTQADKTYTANITTDAALRFVIGNMISQFRLDISATHKSVVDAKQAVVKVLSELAKLGGAGDINASSSAGTNNQL